MKDDTCDNSGSGASLESKLGELPMLDGAVLSSHEERRLSLLKGTINYSCDSLPVRVYDASNEMLAELYRKSNFASALLSRDVLKKKFNEAIIDYVAEADRVIGVSFGGYISKDRASKLVFSFLKFGNSYSRNEIAWDASLSKQRTEELLERSERSPLK